MRIPGVPRPPAWLPLFRGPNAGAVYLTFDDGPDPEFTPRVLDSLARRSWQATFFVVGERAVRHPELVRRIVAEGHSLGLHGFRHQRRWLAAPGRLRRELEGALAELRRLVPGAEVRFFRPPFGVIAPWALPVLAGLGLRLVLWSLDARDYRSRGVDEVIHRATRARRGEVVLLHDAPPGGVVTARALPEILARLEQRGFRGERLED